MRWVLVVVAVAGCGGDDAPCTYNDHGYQVGDVWPKGDGCNSCRCTTSGPSCTQVACADAGVSLACGPSGGCPMGPVCGALCCNAGEKCVDNVCYCNTSPHCPTAGDSCERAGPVGSDGCGTVCCGVSGPCPQ